MAYNNITTANPWTPEQDALLRQHFGLMDDNALAAMLLRSVSSLAGRANRIRIRKEDNRARKANPESAHIHRTARPKPGAGLQDIMATATPYGPAPIPAMGATARAIIANSNMRGTYTAPELRPFEGRPGAMDAFSLPSRRFDRRVYRDGRVEGVA